MNTSSKDHDNDCLYPYTHYIASMMSPCADIGSLRGNVPTDVRIHCESKEIGGHGIILSSRYSFLCHLLVCCQAVSVSVFERGKCSGARHFRRNVSLNNPRRKMCKVEGGLELKNPGEPQSYDRDHHEHEESYLQLSCSDECCSQITQQKHSRKEFPESH